MTFPTTKRLPRFRFFALSRALALAGALASLVLLLVPGAAEAWVNPAQNEREALVRVVTKWDSNCDGSNVTSWDNMLKSWYDEMADGANPPSGHGGNAWNKDGFYQNGTIVDSNFTDDDIVAWGKDDWSDRVDEGDAVMIGLHGFETSADSGFRWGALVRQDEAGDGNCGSFQGHMEFGDNDTEFLHLSSCFSMDRWDWHPDWSSSFDGLHQVHGFHGIMWISTVQNSWYRGFADDGFDVGLGLAWIDNLYSPRAASPDQCAVPRGVGIGGNGEASCVGRLNDERYNKVYPEPTAITYHCVYYVEGCDPKGKSALPSLTTEPLFETAPSFLAAAPILPASTPSAGPNQEFDAPPVLDRTAMDRAAYEALVEATLPGFDGRLLATTVGTDWSANLGAEEAARALGIDTPEKIETLGARTEARDDADTLVVKIDRDEGYLRFIHRDRVFDWDSSPRLAWDAGSTGLLVLDALHALGVPRSEIDERELRVETLLGETFASSDTSGNPAARFEAERVIDLERRVNGFPVIDSRMRATVSNRGELARLRIDWPQFRPTPGLQLRPRAEVVTEIVDAIEAAEGGLAIDLETRLGYARFGDTYRPVVVAAFSDVLAGQEVIVPLAEVVPGADGDGDRDGVADLVDLCPEHADPAQRDTDGDGIGDACDVCPDVFDPKQSDQDGDGTGDACATREVIG